jgi:hypothetical protein
MQHFARRTAERPVRLERKGFASEAASFPGNSGLRRAVAGLQGPRLVSYRSRTGKLGGAQWLKQEVMAQFQPQVPDPLTNDLPGFLPAICA